VPSTEIMFHDRKAGTRTVSKVSAVVGTNEATVLTSLTFLGLSIGQKQQQQQRNTRLTTSFMLGRSNKKVLLNQLGQSIV